MQHTYRHLSDETVRRDFFVAKYYNGLVNRDFCSCIQILVEMYCSGISEILSSSNNGHWIIVMAWACFFFPQNKYRLRNCIQMYPLLYSINFQNTQCSCKKLSILKARHKCIL